MVNLVLSELDVKDPGLIAFQDCVLIFQSGIEYILLLISRLLFPLVVLILMLIALFAFIIQ